VAEQVRNGRRTQGADRVDEQRMRAVERVDEAAAGDFRPARHLDRTADFQRQLIEGDLPFRRVEAPFAREPPQVPVGADVVEAVVVDAGVGQVAAHALDRPRAAELEKVAVAGGVELQQRRAEGEALRPLRPAARTISAADREHRRAIGRIPGSLDRSDLLRRQLEQVIDRAQEILGPALPTEPDHLVS
jgi:hypothetical protein